MRLAPGLAAALTACATAPPAERVTIEQVRADPAAYAGRTLRLRGTMDECWNMSCNICPEAAPATAGAVADRCLAVSFRPLPGGGGRSAADAAARHATLTLQARFDPACLEGLCLDRGSVLLDAVVLQVHRRAPAPVLP